VGRNVLGNPGDVPVVRPFGDWLDREHIMVARGGSGHVCVSLPSRAPDVSGCADEDQRAKETRDASRLVVTGNLQEKLKSRLAELVQ
ncbi:MAG TPA: hypothetical protein VHZ73_06125, partial [Vicinamibacterales bacterium]|nr:hypothetical protein [Vicinamibacterales bacterium]